MSITEITILLTIGPDICMMSTNLPSSMPNVTKENALLKLEVEHDGGEDYCVRHFPNIPYEIVNVR